MLKGLNKSPVLLIIFALSCLVSSTMFSQTVTVIAPVASATYCAGTNITVNYTVTSNFGAGNVFTTQLSNAAGSFTSPTTLGTRTAVNGGGSTFTIPFTTPTGSGYRVRF